MLDFIQHRRRAQPTYRARLNGQPQWINRCIPKDCPIKKDLRIEYDTRPASGGAPARVVLHQLCQAAAIDLRLEVLDGGKAGGQTSQVPN